MLRDGSESTNAASVHGKEDNSTSEVPDKERLRAANALLFSDLRLSKPLVRSEYFVLPLVFKYFCCDLLSVWLVELGNRPTSQSLFLVSEVPGHKKVQRCNRIRASYR